MPIEAPYSATYPDDGPATAAQEIAERLGANTHRVWAQARAGQIPHVRLGRYQRFRESAIGAWTCELEAASTGRPPGRLQHR